MACSAGNCVAEPLERSTLCAVHAMYTRRVKGDATLRCYACGQRVRIGRRWVVRAEGAFHNRARCLTADPASYAIGIR